LNTALVIAAQDEEWRRMVGWLRQFDLDTIHSASWVTGRKELERNPEIEVVLLDAGFDEEAGIKFLTMLRRDPRLSRVPVIVGGKEFSDDMIRRYTRLKVSDVLLLPTVMETLEGKVKKAIDTGRPTILVVDDDEMVRLHLAEFLLLERYRPIIVKSAPEAEAILKQQQIDAVITDISLPRFSGLDLLVEIKREYPLIPVIMITGHSGKFGPTEVLSMGADGYFTKPFHNLDLMYTLHRALTERPRQRSGAKPAPASQPK
jgi:DNA-binding NtrC family response regulator